MWVHIFNPILSVHIVICKWHVCGPPPSNTTKPASGSGSAARTAPYSTDARSHPPTRRNSNPFNDSFRIIWGTRIPTSVESILSALSDVLKVQHPDSVRVVKSVKRGHDDRTKWWFTVMAPHDVLTNIESAWPATLDWKLQHSLRPPSLDNIPPSTASSKDSPMNQPSAEPASQTSTPTLANGEVPHANGVDPGLLLHQRMLP